MNDPFQALVVAIGEATAQRLDSGGPDGETTLTFAKRIFDALQAAVEPATATWEKMKADLAAARAANEYDRTVVADATAAVHRAISSREWMRDGRGSFAYDDVTYQKEFGDAMNEILQAVEPLDRVGRDLAHTPQAWPEIAAARGLTEIQRLAIAAGNEPYADVVVCPNCGGEGVVDSGSGPPATVTSEIHLSEDLLLDAVQAMCETEADWPIAGPMTVANVVVAKTWIASNRRRLDAAVKVLFSAPRHT